MLYEGVGSNKFFTQYLVIIFKLLKVVLSLHM